MMYRFRQLCLLLVVFMASFSAFGQNPDIDLLYRLNRKTSAFRSTLAKFSTASVTPVSLGVPAGYCIAGLVKKNKALLRQGAYMAGGYFISAMVTQAAKRVIGRKRPYESYGFIVRRADAEDGRSFPSGHTSAAFATATSLALYCRHWYIAVPAYLWAGSVGYARMYQGVHYPTDVLVGALTGAASAWVSWKIDQWQCSRKQKSNKTAGIARRF